MNKFSFFRTGTEPTEEQCLGVNYKGCFHRFELETFHLNETPHHGQSPEHRHDVYHIVLYTRANTMMLNGETLNSATGSLIWTSPGEFHSFAARSKESGQYHEITFSLLYKNSPLTIPFTELLSLYFGGTYSEPTRPFMLSEQNFNTLNSAYENIAATLRMTKDNEKAPSVKVVLTSLLATFADILNSNPFRPANIDERILRATELLKKNPGEHVSLKMIASEVAMSREYFCRKFKFFYGISPLQYRREYRLATAAQILRYTEKTIKEISDELGFNDTHHFTHAFTSFYNIPPKRFRLRSHGR